MSSATHDQDVLARLAAQAGSLSPTEGKLAAYIRRRAAEVPEQSVYEVARAAGASVASVSRLAARLGFESFRAFKIALARETSLPISTIYGAIELGDSDAEVVRKVFAGHIKSLEDTLKLIKMEECARAAAMLNGARRIVFLGIGASGNVGRDAALRFSHLNLPAEAYADSYEILIHAAGLKKGDVAFGVSHSGRSAVTVEALRMAGERGAATIGISNYLNSPLHEASDLFFCTSFPEPGVRSTALSAVAAQVCVMDALYVLAARKGKGMAGVDEINEMIETRFRLSGRVQGSGGRKVRT